MMKRRTLQACCLRHSIKKGMFSVHGNLDLLKVGRGESSPPPPPSLATRLYKFNDVNTLPKVTVLSL